jgi:hypothetical protein
MLSIAKTWFLADNRHHRPGWRWIGKKTDMIPWEKILER